uniref:Distal membrane arm assembly component 1 n=1 Tax=Corvus moneduloides TaxID=1196302 RepID=A0A8U7N7H9_CORMO
TGRPPGAPQSPFPGDRPPPPPPGTFRAAPGAVSVPGPGSASPRPLLSGCWSCRLLSGAGLLMAAIWIYQGPRSTMRKGVPPSMGVGAWGIIILADPMGKQRRREP